MTAKKAKWFSVPAISIVLLMTANSGLASTPKIDRGLNLCAVGDRGPCSGDSRTGFSALGIGKKRSRTKRLVAVALGLIVIVATVACFAALPAPPVPSRSWATSWTISTIDSSGGGRTSIALDSIDKVHVIYMGGEGLKYATNAGGSWVASTVGESCWIYSSLALDSDDKAHISYDQYTDHSSLVYTTNADGSWANYTVDSTFTTVVGWYTSLALDSEDKVHISYMELNPHASGNEVKYATNAGGSWSVFTIDDSEFFTGYAISLAVDSANKVHVSYVAGNDLTYATNAGGSWTTYVLAYAGIYHYASTSIALDSNDKVHICYNVGTRLAYITNASGSWTIETVEEASDIRSIGFISISLALDSNDKAHVSYNETWNGNLKYATNAGGSWVNSTIEAGVLGCSLALDSADQVHISYYGSEGIMYATNAGQVIPEFGAAGVVVVVIATVCVFVVLRRSSFPPTKD